MVGTATSLPFMAAITLVLRGAWILRNSACWASISFLVSLSVQRGILISSLLSWGVIRSVRAIGLPGAAFLVVAVIGVLGSIVTLGFEWVSWIFEVALEVVVGVLVVVVGVWAWMAGLS